VNATVVVIDANPQARARAAEALGASGLSVVCFEGAHAFFCMLDGRTPLLGTWCVVVDAELTDMTCHQLLAEVARRGLPAPLIFLMNAGQLELASALTRAGAADVFQKPIDADELVRRVLGMLRDRAQLAVRHPLGRLTQRELEVVTLISRGLSNNEIADQLSISFRTVEVHRRNAMRKTGTSNNVELTRFLRERNPLSMTDREREISQVRNDGLTNRELALRLSLSARTLAAQRRPAANRSELAQAVAAKEMTPRARDAGQFAFELRAKRGLFELELRVAWAQGEATALWEFESKRGLSLVSVTSSDRVDESFSGQEFPEPRN
jgi:two-component system response regulator TtrR